MKIFSIVTINFNNLGGLKKTVASVIEQDRNLFEFIVVDGGSDDGSVDFLKGTGDDIDQLIIEKDRGIYDAMNKGIGRANGVYTWFLNSGDVFASGDTLKLLNFEIEHLEHPPDVCYGNVVVSYSSGFDRVKKPSPLRVFWRRLPFSHQGVICKTYLYKDLKFDYGLSITADHAFFYKVFLAGKKYSQLDMSFAVIESGGKSEQHPGKVLHEKVFTLKKNGSLSIVKKIYLYGQYLIRSFVFRVKKLLPKKLVDRLTRIKYLN